MFEKRLAHEDSGEMIPENRLLEDEKQRLGDSPAPKQIHQQANSLHLVATSADACHASRVQSLSVKSEKSMRSL